MPLALGGKAGALRARPLNDPAACAESFEAPPRVAPKSDPRSTGPSRSTRPRRNKIARPCALPCDGTRGGIRAVLGRARGMGVRAGGGGVCGAGLA